MRLTLNQLLERETCDKIRCPYCGRRSTITRYILREVFPRILDALRAGDEIIVTDFGVFRAQNMDPDSIHDLYFHDFAGKPRVPILHAARSVINDFLKLDKETSKQNTQNKE